jgi:hypothetical protein
MQLIWTQADPNQSDVNQQPFQGNYQDVLRSIGAWIDARGFQLSRIMESSGNLIIEVETGVPGDDLNREVIRLNADSVEKLTVAARNDRNRFSALGTGS